MEDEREKRRDALCRACDAIKFLHPEINDAWDRWRAAARAAGLDFDDDVTAEPNSPELPAEVLAAHRHLEAVEAAIEERILKILETPLLNGNGGHPMTPTEEIERFAALRRKVDEILDASGHQRDDAAIDGYDAAKLLTFGDLRDISLLIDPEFCRPPSRRGQHADA